jgi:hypothetical protein
MSAAAGRAGERALGSSWRQLLSKEEIYRLTQKVRSTG